MAGHSVSELCFSPNTIFIYLVDSTAVNSICRAALEMNAHVNHDSFLNWLIAFTTTCVIEAPIYMAIGRTLDRSYQVLALQLILLNLATHPLVFWASSRVTHFYAGPEWASTLGGELFAPGVEGVLLYFVYRYPLKYAIAAALLANLASWWLGAYLN